MCKNVHPPPRAPPQLASTEEFVEGTFSGNLGEVLIRCNNVLYVRGVPEDDDEGDGGEGGAMDAE